MPGQCRRVFSYFTRSPRHDRSWCARLFHTGGLHPGVYFDQTLGQHSYWRHSHASLFLRRSSRLQQKDTLAGDLSARNNKHDNTYRAAYDRFDKMQDGNVGVDEFVHHARSFGLILTEEEVEHLYSSFKLKKYGQMDFEEFVRFMDQLRDKSGHEYLNNVEAQREILLEVAQKDKEAAGEREKKLLNWTDERYWEVKLEEAKGEWQHYKRGFSLLKNEVYFAKERFGDVLEGRELSQYESRKVQRAMTDLLRLVPMGAIALLPGGSIVVGVLAKWFPKLLPTTFHVENMSQERRTERVALEMTAAIEEMERKLRKENSDWVKNDEKFSRLLNKVLGGEIKSLQDLFEGDGVVYANDVNLGSEGMLDRLDEWWLLAISCSFVSDKGQRALSKAPVPILRSIVKRYVRHITTTNVSLNNNQKGLEGLVHPVYSPEEEVKTRGLPHTIAVDEVQLWCGFQDNRSVLLALMLHVREDYLNLLPTEGK